MKRVSFVLSENTIKGFRKACKEENLDPNEVLNELLQDWLFRRDEHLSEVEKEGAL